MPRFKDLNYAQGQFIPVRFDAQILPGTFEHALNFIVDHKLDLSVFDPLYQNDQTGAPAYEPRVLLKIILFAYSRGLLSSRAIERACQENILFMALSANSRPHFTTIASFVSGMQSQIKPLFRDILLYCYSLGLIGKDMFAIDGCKITSNASKEWSGTRHDFENKKRKFEAGIQFLLDKHRSLDEAAAPDKIRQEKEDKALRKLEAKVAKLAGWLKEHEDKPGAGGQAVQQNMTDPDSAKLVSSHGVVQGYNGLAAVDSKHQVIVAAEAFGTGSETPLLKPLVEATEEAMKDLGEEGIPKDTPLTADSGFHSEANMKWLFDKGIDAYVADRYFRKRDPRFESAPRHKGPVYEWKKKANKRKYFGPDDFVLNPESGKLICPAGNALYVKDRNFQTRGFKAIAYMAKGTDCRACPLKAKCLRNPSTRARQVHKFYGRDRDKAPQSFTQEMIRKIDSLKGRYLYSRRMGVVEPVFGHLRHALGLDRFTLRGGIKVNIQWKLYAMVHNLAKIYRYGWAAG